MVDERVMKFAKIAAAVVLAFVVIQLISSSFFCPTKPPKKEGFADLAELDALAGQGDAAAPTMEAVGVASDLLPKQVIPDEQFADLAPKALEGQNFLDATKFVGIDTIGTTNKNANRQIRADPPIPRKAVSPWLQSSYDTKDDDLRKPLE
jgi:hypothetical protein